MELSYKLLNISQQVKNINSLFQSLRWKMWRKNVNLEFFFSKYSHMLISLPIMRRQGCHFIKDLIQVMFHFLPNADLFLKQVQICHPSIVWTVINLVLERISLLKVANDSLMEKKSEFLFYLSTYWLDHIELQSLVSFFLIVVYSDLRWFQMFNVL